MAHSPTVIHAIVAERDAHLRLDRWLATLEFIPSRSRAAELIEKGLVTLHGKKLKPSHRVAPGTSIQIVIPAPVETGLIPLNSRLDILYEDEDLIVVNKPSGLVVHPAAGHEQDTLVNILLHHVGHLSMGFNERRPGIVHRLDRDTSGVLVAAKNDFTHQHLARQFREKSVHRIYWAVVAGNIVPGHGILKSHLARHPTDRKRFASSRDGTGKLAITHYRVMQKSGKCSLTECRLETGRTHQIRVHLSELGHPLLGDPIYGGKFKRAAPRLMLHACELGFQHPRSSARLTFKEPWPPDVAEFLLQMGFKS